MRRNPSDPPRPGSKGEETLALHLRAVKIAYRREVYLIPGRRWRWDFLVGDLAIEIHGATWIGGAHSRGDGQMRDFQKSNAAVKAGYRPLVYSTGMIISGEALEDIKELLRTTSPHIAATPSH